MSFINYLKCAYVPDWFLCRANNLPTCSDVLSSYKEAMCGESGTYLQDRAVLSGKSRSETLYDIIDDTAAASERVRAILGNGQARDAWEAFMIGYLSFHMSAPRYRLPEIVDAKYILA